LLFKSSVRGFLFCKCKTEEGEVDAWMGEWLSLLV
jgi:hypothetical protein